jgi:hypothetical protein
LPTDHFGDPDGGEGGGATLGRGVVAKDAEALADGDGPLAELRKSDADFTYFFSTKPMPTTTRM